ncbi:DUF2130 domain-containing protein [Aquirufa nivalisilvae]
MTNKIQCPNCGHQFDVEEALSGKLESHYKKEYEKNVAKQAEIFNQEKEKLEQERLRLQNQAENQSEVIKKELDRLLTIEKQKIEQSVIEQFNLKIKSLEEENLSKQKENKELREKELSLLKKEADLKEKEEEFQYNLEKQLLERQSEIENKARQKERDSFELEKLQLLKQIDDNRKLAEEMKRKAEQGSMQLQGEIQELALEDLLTRTYPFDKIQEVPKGIRGADSIQVVVNANQQECGSIVYESKRTKNFANEWIDKLKQDQITCKADIAVLVTETLPSDMERFGERNGVWICGFHEIKSVSLVLREMLIKTHEAKETQVNKGDKMELLYSYLTSNEFVQNIKRIVENYDSMVDQLNSEKKAMFKIWAAREKQIWVVQENISMLFGSIKGIAGKELSSSGVLELPDKEID